MIDFIECAEHFCLFPREAKHYTILVRTGFFEDAVRAVA
jgi:hypothetical protein